MRNKDQILQNLETCTLYVTITHHAIPMRLKSLNNYKNTEWNCKYVAMRIGYKNLITTIIYFTCVIGNKQVPWG